jgi:hypothetical protein
MHVNNACTAAANTTAWNNQLHKGHHCQAGSLYLQLEAGSMWFMALAELGLVAHSRLADGGTDLTAGWGTTFKPIKPGQPYKIHSQEWLTDVLTMQPWHPAMNGSMQALPPILSLT